MSERCELSIDEHDGSCNELDHDKAIAALPLASRVPCVLDVKSRAFSM